ncbi:MAG: NAD(P)-dependent oxidoreductase [Eubacteriales bacterium]|nr:NAD(P)-dependent oxidoreductase [Eubacteriales bacterium]
MRILVTGATSFIGVHLVRKMLHQGHEVYAVIRPNSANLYRLPKHPALTVLEISLNQMETVANHVNHADAFFHLAWEGARAPYRDDSALQADNYWGAVSAILAAHKMHCRLFVGSGSQAEYGQCVDKVDEAAVCDPLTPYGKEKLHAYRTLMEMSNGMQLIWTRIFSVYGQYDYPTTLVMSCLRDMKQKSEIQLTACSQLWDYLYVEDAAEALLRFLNTETESGIYNLASGNARPLKAYVEDIRHAMNYKGDILYGAIPYGKEGSIALTPSIAKIQKAIGWNARTSFAQGIQKLIDIQANESKRGA